MKLSTNGLVLASDAVVDLHTHTIYSDGTWLPDQLIAYAASEQFGLIAISDHDRVNTLVSLQQLALEKQFPVLVAVEMSASWKGEPVDVLCYGFDPENNALDDLAQDVARRQRENTLEVYENLRRKGYAFSEAELPDEIAAILDMPSSGHPFALVALLTKHGYGGTVSPGKILKEAGCDYATTGIASVVDAAHKSGAAALIAHPGRGGGFLCFDAALLDELRREVPIDGLEVYYPAHTPEQIEMYQAYAQKHGLLMSSGSDSHGPDRKPIPYQAQLNRSLLERIGVQVA